MNNTRNIIITMAIALLLIAVAFFTGRCTAPSREVGEETHSDTIHHYHTDTIKVDTIIYRTKRVTDTLYLHDTILLREQLEYQDSFATIWVSGIEPALDSVEYRIPMDTAFILKETTITIDKPQKHWKQFIGFGVHLGVSAGYNPIERNAAIVAPEIGVGFVYGIGYVW